MDGQTEYSQDPYFTQQTGQRNLNEPIRNVHAREYSQDKKIEKGRTRFKNKEQVYMTTLNMRTLRNRK